MNNMIMMPDRICTSFETAVTNNKSKLQWNFSNIKSHVFLK